MDYKRPSLLHPEGNPFETVEGFNFNRGDFEDMIDNFMPPESIPILLQVSEAELDVFCNEIYRMNFKTTYDVLFQRANLYYQKAMFMLSKSGNPSAIKLTAEYYVGLGKVGNNDNHITFIGIMPDAPSDYDGLSDLERVKKQQTEATEAIKKEFEKK